MKIVIIDGQGGGFGGLIAQKIKEQKISCEIYAIGTNSIATATMLKNGADFGATGENPCIVHAKDADFIVGPIGIVIANSLLGEITPKMAVSVGRSKAQKLLLPSNRCNNNVIGAKKQSPAELCEEAVLFIKNFKK